MRSTLARRLQGTVSRLGALSSKRLAPCRLPFPATHGLVRNDLARCRFQCTIVTTESLSKQSLIDAYQAIGKEARQVMLDNEARFRREVDEKADSGVDVDICASMYGHQMAGYMGEFLPTREDSVVNQIRDRILAESGIGVDQANEAFETYKNDQEVQITLQTMYQHKLDEVAINSELTIDKYVEITQALREEVCLWVEKIHQNLDGRKQSYMTGNMKLQMEQARMAVPSIAIFSAQYKVLRQSGFGHVDKLVADVLYSPWPQAQQANAQLHQALNDKHLACYTPDQESIQKMQEMQQSAMPQ